MTKEEILTVRLEAYDFSRGRFTSALYVCIEDVVKDTIKKAKEQKLFKI